VEQGSNRGAEQPSADVVSSGDAAFLERLRQSGISVNREGTFIHEGQPVEHEGLRRALFRWLDRLPDGRYALRLDDKRFAYLDVVDTPLVAHGARFVHDGFALALSDGSEERLDPSTLTVDDAGIFRCWVRGGVLEARLSTSAATVIAERIVVEQGDVAFRSDGQTFVVGPRRQSALA
jgi:hypothetical protein